MFESGMRFFPDDYPESVCFDDYNRNRAVDLISKYRRMPPQKRCNYEHISSPFPFYLHIPKRSSPVVPVMVSMLSRGKCETGSYICRLEQEDYCEIAKQL